MYRHTLFEPVEVLGCFEDSSYSHSEISDLKKVDSENLNLATNKDKEVPQENIQEYLHALALPGSGNSEKIAITDLDSREEANLEDNRNFIRSENNLTFPISKAEETENSKQLAEISTFQKEFKSEREKQLKKKKIEDDFVKDFTPKKRKKTTKPLRGKSSYLKFV